jgi:predicted RNA binding protein YcfA (HicA-like mRNA interferase family)
VPSPVRFAIVRKLLQRNGWTFARVKGSHHQFTKPGQRTLVVAVHGGKVPYGYVREIEKILKEEQNPGA